MGRWLSYPSLLAWETPWPIITMPETPAFGSSFAI